MGGFFPVEAAAAPTGHNCPLVSNVQELPGVSLIGATLQAKNTDIGDDGRLYPAEILLLKKGHAYRRIRGEPFYWDWIFWDAGRQIIADTSRLHGDQEFSVIQVDSGEIVKSVILQDGKNPAWADALARHESASSGTRSVSIMDCRFRGYEASKSR